jgi:hypothetical protein
MITLVEVAVYSFLKANINEKVEYIIQLPPGFTICEIQLWNILWSEAKTVGDFVIVIRWTWYIECFAKRL